MSVLLNSRNVIEKANQLPNWQTQTLFTNGAGGTKENQADSYPWCCRLAGEAGSTPASENAGLGGVSRKWG